MNFIANDQITDGNNNKSILCNEISTMVSDEQSESKQLEDQYDHDDDGVTRKLCQWIQAVSLNDIPEDVRLRAKYLVLDGLACAIVGARLPWTETAARTVFDMEPTGNCKVWGYDDKVRQIKDENTRLIFCAQIKS